MLPHLKKYTKEEKEAARKAFDESSRIIAELMKNQPKYTKKEMLSMMKRGHF
jgi:hypothetical protein